MTAAPRDPYLELPLDGVHAIEASAGTGKTFTLATLVVRLVVERGLRIGQILAVTFTEAATQELRARIRKRLNQAALLTDAPAIADVTPEAVLTRAVLDAHLARGEESPAALRKRLRAAADEIDLASIFTIHAFCARVLREHALESGQGFAAPELMTSDSALREAIAADLWRSHGTSEAAADDLLALWPQGPAALAGDLSPLVRERLLQPALVDLPEDPTPRLRAAADALAVATRAHGDDFRTALVAAVEGKILNGQSYKVDWLNALFASLATWAALNDLGIPFDHAKLGNLRRETLTGKTNKAAIGRTPESPLSDVVSPYLQALADLAAWHDARRVQLLHRLRDHARVRFARVKREQQVQTYDDLIDGVADAVDGPHADALVAALRAQYAIALVDEFQDTDPRQWRIFERVFGAASGAPSLFVIGDPKQAIYGFRGGDVDTYLDATKVAVEAPPLSQNFRSRPSVLKAITALYAHAQQAFEDDRDKDDKLKVFDAPPFVIDGIVFRDVQPGGTRRDDDFVRDGVPAAALTVWRPPAPQPGDDGKAKPYGAGRSRELATQACVAAIHRVLSEARAGKASIEGRAVQPGDIAVLVRAHHEATRIRDALASVGIPAVAAGKQNLFATGEARDVHALLLALLHGADDGRLRMALSTVLVGLDAQHVAALSDVSAHDDGAALRHWQLAALAWRDRLQRGGPLALINDLCAQHAQRLLGLLDGERRLSNYLQVAELLQDAQGHALGLHGLVDWLARAIADASADDDTQLLRLESDARRVQVITLHKSKGLEYPLVFLPFAGVGGHARSSGQHVTVGGGAHRTLHWNLQAETSGWSDAKKASALAERAEGARLLYVGLTRARDALWLAGGPLYNHMKSPLAAMIRDADALAETPGAAIVIDDSTPHVPLGWMPLDAHDTVPDARRVMRALASDWWVYSFTQLSNAEGGNDASSAATQPAPGGQDEPVADADAAAAVGVDAGRFDPEAIDTRFTGTRFGVVLHDVLERSDFAQWRDWTPAAPAPLDAHTVIVERLRAGGYAAHDIDDGIAALTPLVGQTLTVALPEGVRLADVPRQDRRAEIEFQFSLAPTRVDALLALLHRHGLVAARSGFGMRRKLEGLMTGLIDLTYMHDGRWYVLDYKSNRLPGFGAAQLDEAMAHSEYDLQALIYTLALHRWLRFRVGDAYDYARDFGGVRYLFCRGLDAARTDAPGVQAWRFDPALVHALDALFAGNPAAAAA